MIKLKDLIFLGLFSSISLFNCVSYSKPINFENQFGGMLAILKKDPWVFMIYDKNNDGKRDNVLVYKIKGETDNYLYLELDEVWEDKNGDGDFEDDGEKRKLSGRKYMPNIPYSDMQDIFERAL